jgi:hypothetical protein
MGCGCCAGGRWTNMPIKYKVDQVRRDLDAGKWRRYPFFEDALRAVDDWRRNREKMRCLTTKTGRV